MAKNIIDNSKEFLQYYYIVANDEWVDEPDFKFNNREVSDEVKEFIGDFFHLLLDSDILGKYTKIWIKSSLTSMRQCFEAYNNQHALEDKVDIHNAEAAIAYDKRKLKKYFDEDMLYNVLAYPEQNLKTYASKLALLRCRYDKNKKYSNAVALNIPSDIMEVQITDEEWERLYNILSVYSKRTIDLISSNEDNAGIFGYFNYIVNSKRLSSIDKDRLSQIDTLFGLDKKGTDI